MENIPPPVAVPGRVAPGVRPETAGIAVTSLVLGILSLTCFSIFTGIPALICGTIALGRIRSARGSLTGQGLAISGVVMGGLSILMIPVLIGLCLPAFASAREEARRVQCMSQEKQIGAAFVSYVNDHDGKAPQTFEDLRPYGITDAILHCPAAKDRSVRSYQLMPGTKPTDVIVREDPSDHRRGSNVVYGDGHGEWVPANRQ